VRVTYLDLVDYLAIAAEVTGLGVATLSRVTQLNLADSALHAPAAGWGEEELYPDFVDKAAVLVVRLAKNHPLLDGNKRAAWVSLRAFIELNDWSWATYPSIDEAEQAMVAIASGEWDEARVASWLRDRIEGPARGEAPTERS
jgi:death-on-curing protein